MPAKEFSRAFSIQKGDRMMKNNRNRPALPRLLCIMLAAILLFLSVGCQTIPTPEESPVPSVEEISSLPESAPPESEEISEIPAESEAESVPSKTDETKSVESAEPVESTISEGPTESDPLEEPVESESPPPLKDISTTPTPLPDQAKIIEMTHCNFVQYLPNNTLYYRISSLSPGVENGYFCMAPDGSQKQALNLSEFGRFVAYHDGWIYYTDGNDPADYFDSLETLYRMRADGSDQTKMEGTFGIEVGFESAPKIFGNWLYFVSRNVLYRISLDGSECQTVLDLKTEYYTYFLSEKGIFFSAYMNNENYQERIMHCELDGSNLEVLLHCPGETIYLRALEDDVLYFTKSIASDPAKNQICRIELDGSHLLSLTAPGQHYDENMVIKDGWIYYQAYYQGFETSLARTDINGNETQILVQGISPRSWELHGNYLYYRSTQFNQSMTFATYNVCRLDLDGKNHVVLYEITSDDPVSLISFFVYDSVPYVVTFPQTTS